MAENDGATERPSRSWIFVWLGVAAIAVLHFVLANAGTWNKCGTFDESSHIANGYNCWANGDYRMPPVAVLQHRWITLPLYLGDYKAPPPEGDMWITANNWTYGRQFLFELGNDSQSILHTARIMTSLWSVMLCVLIFVWSREFFGTAGGFVSLVLYAFNPNVLAHASSATIDLPAALAFTVGLWTFWRLLQRMTFTRLLVSSVVWGLAMTSKFSTLLLAPIGIALMALRFFQGSPWPIEFGRRRYDASTRMSMLKHFIVVFDVHLIVVMVIIWAMFGFRFSMYAPDLPPPIPEVQFGAHVKHAHSLEPVLQFFHDYRLFPEAYLWCFCDTRRTMSGFNSFLNGRFGIDGFASYFPYCMLYKTPFAVFLVALAALAAHFVYRSFAIRRLGKSPWRLMTAGLYATAPLWVLIVAYWTAAINEHINIGIRHVLPTFPATFILLGAAGRWLRMPAKVTKKPETKSPPPSRRRQDEAEPATGDDPRSMLAHGGQLGALWAVVVCLLWFVVDVVSSYPNYLAYFNFIGGGSKNGYRHLADSSFDWGQELPSLAKWLEQETSKPDRPQNVYFCYFGSTPPSVFGIKAIALPWYFDREMLEPKLQMPLEELQPGAYIISATMVDSVYNKFFPGPWREDYEALYRQMRPTMKQWFDEPATRQPLVAKYGQQAVLATMYQYEWLRLARLCAYLRRKEPLTSINHGILVYQVTIADLQAAQDGAPVEAYPPPKDPRHDAVPY